MQQNTSMAYPLTQVDAQNALQLSKTKDILDQFWVDWCGLKAINRNDQIIYVRVSKPKFTAEIAKKIESRIYIEINRLTGRTHYSPDQLDRLYIMSIKSMSEWFATEVFHNLISPTAWERCLELSQPDTNADAVKDSEGHLFHQNFWKTKYNIDWHYDLPVNIEMLNIIKKEHNLKYEKFGQGIILRDIFWAIRIFIEGGLNRSMNHLTLDHEKTVHKETIAQHGEAQVRQSEGAIEAIKRFVRRE